MACPAVAELEIFVPRIKVVQELFPLQVVKSVMGNLTRMKSGVLVGGDGLPYYHRHYRKGRT